MDNIYDKKNKTRIKQQQAHHRKTYRELTFDVKAQDRTVRNSGPF